MTPSSRFLAKKMLHQVDFKQARVIVELGPGTGVFTDRIIQMMSKEAILLVFELNDDFYESLHKRIQDPRVHIIHDTAEKIEFYLKELNIDKADVVISSLPLANFPSELRQSILSTSHNSLHKLGKYIQFQYSLQSRRQIKSMFHEVEISFTPFNFPPAFIYTCKKEA